MLDQPAPDELASAVYRIRRVQAGESVPDVYFGKGITPADTSWRDIQTGYFRDLTVLASAYLIIESNQDIQNAIEKLKSGSRLDRP